MDNQHRQIKGYRELSEADIALMNEIKEEGVRLGALVEKLRQHESAGGKKFGESAGLMPPLDQRWVSIGATHFQEGLMALTRAVAQPTFF